MTDEELLEQIETARRKGGTVLNLSGQGLTSLPPELGQLTHLTSLWLINNQLAELPPELGQLTKLTTLLLSNNRLSALPSELGQLTNLHTLWLNNNQLSGLPPELGQLTKLTTLLLSSNPLSAVPPELGQITSLHTLWLGNNQWTHVPTELFELANLTTLDLSGNRLPDVPVELFQLANLTQLDLSDNQLTALPPELGQLTSLTRLFIQGNTTLKSPPPEVVEQGTQAILSYLRDRLEDCEPQWVSKLLVVGEGGVGKTSLLRTLRGEAFRQDEETTHGIRIDRCELDHPTKPKVRMRLNAWDFGGQEIYHATHQFFLTNRSLFMVAWNTRLGFEQGKLYYWLDTISALAPDSPILLVATHTDERDADLPYTELQRKYPQIAGHCAISSKSGDGLDTLREAIRREAAGLPLMGEIWPARWLAAANALRRRRERHITPKQLWDQMARHGVSRLNATVLARWLHELGEILYFRDNEELNDTVILKPEWVTGHVSRVLESAEVIGKDGIFTRQHMDALWSDLPLAMREHFLRLMERFDLSYRTREDKDVSIVVERLPLDEVDYQSTWEPLQKQDGCCEVSMRFRLNTLPAGIPTWFIARQHRFTTGKHWRAGGLFAYEREDPRHFALVKAYSHDRLVELTVRGPNPHNFFALMKDGIEVTLARFPGLQIVRNIPCPGHDGVPCAHEFNYEQLLQRLQKKREWIECPAAQEDVLVSELLFGLHWTTENLVLQRLDRLDESEAQRHAEVLGEMRNLLTLTQRGFTEIFRREQSKPETECPCVFTLRGLTHDGLRGSWEQLAGTKLQLQLHCEAPGHWHATESDGCYEIDRPAEWLQQTAPYVSKLIGVLKYPAPFLAPGLGIAAAEAADEFKNQLKVVDELIKKLPEIKDDPTLARAQAMGDRSDPDRVDGAALRALRALLDEKDPTHVWGGLKKVLTPEGHYLWLCREHAAEYRLD
ncbi:MAG: COR domain-containing protein [Actinomycetota bacterium]